MIAQISAVNIDAESGKLKCLKEKLQHNPHNSICVNRNIITVPVSYFHEKVLCNRSSDAPDPAQTSVVWYTKVVTQHI